jgi:hypothetical protein
VQRSPVAQHAPAQMRAAGQHVPARHSAPVGQVPDGCAAPQEVSAGADGPQPTRTAPNTDTTATPVRIPPPRALPSAGAAVLMSLVSSRSVPFRAGARQGRHPAAVLLRTPPAPRPRSPGPPPRAAAA